MKEIEMEIAEEEPKEKPPTEEDETGIVFKIRDSFLNIGPIANFTLGYAPNANEEEEEEQEAEDPSQREDSQLHFQEVCVL